MNSSKPIGGYFGLEASKGTGFPYSNGLLLNSGRNCFMYILANLKTTHVYLPKFTCDAMLEPLEKIGLKYSFYEIDEKLEITTSIDLRPNELIVYTNYFGAKDVYSRQMSQKYKDQLVLDCSQAFYFKPPDTGFTFYSLRKFFGLPDGGCLVTGKEFNTSKLPVGTSYQRFSHLIKRIDLDAEAGYDDFKREDNLSGEPVQQMSHLTRQLLESIDYKDVQQKRIDNFARLHDKLRAHNKLDLGIEDSSVPMVYPYLADGNEDLRKKLIVNKIFVATYWPNVFEWCSKDDTEYYLAQNILPLPIDQRYGEDDMDRIVEVIHG